MHSHTQVIKYVTSTESALHKLGYIIKSADFKQSVRRLSNGFIYNH